MWNLLFKIVAVPTCLIIFERAIVRLISHVSVRAKHEDVLREKLQRIYQK